MATDGRSTSLFKPLPTAPSREQVLRSHECAERSASHFMRRLHYHRYHNRHITVIY